jgi:predicted Zn-dependent protease
MAFLNNQMLFKTPYFLMSFILSISINLSTQELEVTKEILNEINTFKLKKPIYRTKSESRLFLEQIIDKIKPSAEILCIELSSKEDNCNWELEVVSGNQFNAYASGKNKISFYTGLVRGIYYEEELAFIVAHEIGHHIANHLNESKRSTTIGAVLGAAIALDSDLPPGNAAQLGSYIGRFSFSRRQEIEADAISKRILINSGYDINKARIGLIRLTRTGLSKANSQFLDSHPSGPERVLIFDRM